MNFFRTYMFVQLVRLSRQLKANLFTFLQAL